MNKTAIILGIILALGLAAFFLAGKDSAYMGMNDECPAGYAVVGEGCVTLQEECELQGDQYHYDEASGECVVR